MSKKIAITILKFVLYIAFVVSAIYFTPKILSKILHTPYPLATVVSGSMWPELKINDLIFMRGIDGKDAQVGQIIIFKNQDKGFTIHRLIRINPDGKLVTKGDANNVEDTPITTSDVIGRAIYWGNKPFRVPYLGIIAKNFGPEIQKIEKY